MNTIDWLNFLLILGLVGLIYLVVMYTSENKRLTKNYEELIVRSHDDKLELLKEKAVLEERLLNEYLKDENKIDSLVLDQLKASLPNTKKKINTTLMLERNRNRYR